MKLISKTLFIVAAAILFHDLAVANQSNYTYEKIGKKVGKQDISLISLHKLMRDAITIDESSKTKYRSPLELINKCGTCNKEEYTRLFLELCRQMGIETRRSAFYGKEAFDFYVNDGWVYFDIDEGTFYLNIDNITFASSDNLMDDPFLVLRSTSNLIQAVEASSGYQIVANSDLKLAPNCPVKKPKPGIASKPNQLVVTNAEAEFNYIVPAFQISNISMQPVSEIEWQISSDPEFKFVPTALTGKAPFSGVVKLDPIADTYLNSDDTYYFRVKANSTQWSNTFVFKVTKPESVIDVEFDKVKDNVYEINWGRYALKKNDNIQYLIFGSNALDFVPSIYSNVQINEIVDGKVIDQESNDNLVAVTSNHKIHVDGSLAYYRVIVKENSCLSVPSRLIHVYDNNLIQPRNVMQMTEMADNKSVSKRVLIATTYPWTEPTFSLATHEGFPTIFDLNNTFLKAKKNKPEVSNLDTYPYNPDVPADVWERLSIYFLPENHPAKPKLDRMFSETRIIQSPETFRRAGFTRYRPGRFSRIMASSHPDLKEYFIKAFSDEETRILADWMKLAHRIKGALTVRDCIKEHDLGDKFKVPRKWLYPLPEEPSPPRSSRYLRKNFILVAENMMTVDSEMNKKLYKSSKMDKQTIKGLFTIFHECGMWDSVFAFNCPFCKDGRIGIIDTEYHHKWPITYSKMSKYLSGDMKKYWESLAKKNPSHPEKE